jgi:hypothetical protein
MTSPCRSDARAGSLHNAVLRPNLLRPDADCRTSEPNGGSSRHLRGDRQRADDGRSVGPRHAGGTRSQRSPARYRARIYRKWQKARRSGRHGGSRSARFDRGFFVEPTIFADVAPDMKIAREEIFGPVVTILGYDDVGEAIKIANDTVLGLSGSVFSADPERAFDVAVRSRLVTSVSTGSRSRRPFHSAAARPPGSGARVDRRGSKPSWRPRRFSCLVPLERWGFARTWREPDRGSMSPCPASHRQTAAPATARPRGLPPHARSARPCAAVTRRCA